MPVTNQGRTITQVVVTQGGAGALDLVAAPGAGFRIHVTAVVLSIGTTGSVKFTEGTGPTDLTGAIALTAGSPFVLIANGADPVLSTNTANVKLSLTSATGAITGYIRYFVE